MVCDYRPLKDDPYRVRLTAGGDRLDYADDAGLPAASLLETKLLINSTISDARDGARFLTIDIKDFFLSSPMKKPEYMRIQKNTSLRTFGVNTTSPPLWHPMDMSTFVLEKGCTA